MPTGYTSNIKDGISFKDFALQCARGFGACISMRDEPNNTTIPEEFKPSTYHEVCIKKHEVELKKINGMTILQVEDKAKTAYKKEIEKLKKYINDSNDLLKKYKEMLTQVKNWQSPTTKHTELKSFMIEQIKESIKFDCDNDYLLDQLEKTKLLSGGEWLDKEQKRIIKSLAYHNKKNIEEKSRVAGRNNWIKQLRDSL